MKKIETIIKPFKLDRSSWTWRMRSPPGLAALAMGRSSSSRSRMRCASGPASAATTQSDVEDDPMT